MPCRSSKHDALSFTSTPTTNVYNNVTATGFDGNIITVTPNGTTVNGGTFTVNAQAQGQTTITITALDPDGNSALTKTVTVNVMEQCATPVIEATDNGSTASTVITCTTPGATIYYTTDGSDPDNINGTPYTGAFAITDNTKVKAIAYCEGYYPSDIAEYTYLHTSGIFDNNVVLYDYEDHNWTLFQPRINGDDNPVYLADPKNVKITYDGNGAQVGIDAPQTTFIYYKTLTKENNAYHYTLIPNPFSKRPKNGEQYQGFSKWRVKSITGGTISDYSVGSEIDAETQLTFVPASEYGMEVEFEAVWTTAYVVRCTADQLSSNLNNTNLKGSSYETNFIVVTGDHSSNNLTANSKKVTITMVEPDGSHDYRSNTCYINPGTITLSND